MILSVQEVEAILREAEPQGLGGLRDRAMLETLYSTGMRRMELPGLALYDVDLTRRLVMVREGKGKTRSSGADRRARVRRGSRNICTMRGRSCWIGDTECLVPDRLR